MYANRSIKKEGTQHKHLKKRPLSKLTDQKQKMKKSKTGVRKPVVRSGRCPGVASRPHSIVLSLFDDDIGVLHTHEAGSRSAKNYVDADNQS